MSDQTQARARELLGEPGSAARSIWAAVFAAQWSANFKNVIAMRCACSAVHGFRGRAEGEDFESVADAMWVEMEGSPAPEREAEERDHEALLQALKHSRRGSQTPTERALRTVAALLNTRGDQLATALRERDEARRALDVALDDRNNLLARIHRDGGHYTKQHGVAKALEDAHRIVAELFSERDAARAEVVELRRVVEGVARTNGISVQEAIDMWRDADASAAGGEEG